MNGSDANCADYLASAPGPLVRRLMRRYTEPLGVIDVRYSQKRYAKIVDWINNRFPILAKLMLRYGSGNGQPMEPDSLIYQNSVRSRGRLEYPLLNDLSSKMVSVKAQVPKNTNYGESSILPVHPNLPLNEKEAGHLDVRSKAKNSATIQTLRHVRKASAEVRPKELMGSFEPADVRQSKAAKITPPARPSRIQSEGGLAGTDSPIINQHDIGHPLPEMPSRIIWRTIIKQGGMINRIQKSAAHTVTRVHEMTEKSASTGLTESDNVLAIRPDKSEELGQPVLQRPITSPSFRSPLKVKKSELPTGSLNHPLTLKGHAVGARSDFLCPDKSMPDGQIVNLSARPVPLFSLFHNGASAYEKPLIWRTKEKPDARQLAGLSEGSGVNPALTSSTAMDNGHSVTEMKMAGPESMSLRFSRREWAQLIESVSRVIWSKLMADLDRKGIRVWR